MFPGNTSSHSLSFQRHLPILGPCLAAAIICLLSVSCPAALSVEKTWSVTATSDYAGGLVSQFASGAVRMALDKFGLIIITKGPKWDAVIYSDQNKKYMACPYAEWQEKLNFSLTRKKKTLRQKVVAVKTGKTKSIAGQPTDQFIVKRKPIKGEEGSFSDNGYVEIWMARRIVPPVQFTSMLSALLQIPIDKGLPLLVVQHKEGLKAVTLFETYKVDTAPIPKTTFDVPKGMKKVDDEMELLIGDEDMDMMAGAKAEKSAPPAKKGGNVAPPPKAQDLSPEDRFKQFFGVGNGKKP
jgi:hypothetical protein